MAIPTPSSSPVKRAPLGEILIAQGKISSAELEAALSFRLERGLKLGQALVALRLVTQEELANALQSQGKVHCLHLSPEIVDRSIARELGEARSRQLQAIAVNRIAGVITVAMEDPSEVYNVDALSLQLRTPVLAVHAEPESIRRCLDEVFADAHAQRTQVTDPLSQLLAAGEKSGSGVELEPEREEDNASPSEIQGPVISMVRALFEEAYGAGASDIHLEPRHDGLQVRLRVDGVLFERVMLPRSWVRPVIARLKVLSNLDIAERRLPQDGRAQVEINGSRLDLRVATTPTLYGEGAVIRLMDGGRKLFDLSALALAPAELETLKRMVEGGEGIVLATGPTGSGKTTTLYALLQHLNAPDSKIITVEDPVENQLEGATQIHVNPKIGLTFARGLRSILRQDPDIVLVGEVRDEETAEIAMQAALTGHLVLSTLHTVGTSESITRLCDMGLAPYLLADTLRGIIAQRLVRRICRACRQESAPRGELLTRMQLPPDLVFYEGLGCTECGGTGFRGRLALYEIMSLDAELGSAVRRHAGADELRALAVEHGMVTLREDGLRRALAGETTLAEVHYATARA
ncbi:MAG: Flp pilus assembly complex ATPase component TadA [Planctomycetes bacterium]|nr:Flp pilus assembly complex ATPase component TadA [Planctomycetota bacterium]